MKMEKIMEKLKPYGVGRRGLDDPLFANDKPLARYGIYDVDEERLCHNVIKTTCHIPGCTFTGETLLEYENHYNTSHRHSCSQCKKNLPSAHLLDLHVQEKHDSFFAVMSERKPSYCCYIEECEEKFKTPEDRRAHCISVHKLPKDFRFDLQYRNKNKKNNKISSKQSERMEVEIPGEQKTAEKIFKLNNSKSRAFPKYTGKKFTKTGKNTQSNVNIDHVMEDLKDSLPE